MSTREAWEIAVSLKTWEIMGDFCIVLQGEGAKTAWLVLVPDRTSEVVRQEVENSWNFFYKGEARNKAGLMGDELREQAFIEYCCMCI